MSLIDGATVQRIERDPQRPAPLRCGGALQRSTERGGAVPLERPLQGLLRESEVRFVSHGRRPRSCGLQPRLGSFGLSHRFRRSALLHDLLAAGGARDGPAVERLDGVVGRREHLPLRHLLLEYIVGSACSLALRVLSGLAERNGGSGRLRRLLEGWLLLRPHGAGLRRCGARWRRPVCRHHRECLVLRALHGGRRPVVAGRARRRLVARPERAVHAPVGVDLEVPDHEVAVGRVRQRRARQGTDADHGALGCEVEPVVPEGPLLLARQEGREGALHLVEDPLGHGAMPGGLLDFDALQRAAHQETGRHQQRHRQHGKDDADPSHGHLIPRTCSPRRGPSRSAPAPHRASCAAWRCACRRCASRCARAYRSPRPRRAACAG